MPEVFEKKALKRGKTARSSPCHVTVCSRVMVTVSSLLQLQTPQGTGDDRLNPRYRGAIPASWHSHAPCVLSSVIKCGVTAPGHCHPPIYKSTMLPLVLLASIGAELCTLNINESRVSRLFTPALSVGSTIRIVQGNWPEARLVPHVAGVCQKTC